MKNNLKILICAMFVFSLSASVSVAAPGGYIYTEKGIINYSQSPIFDLGGVFDVSNASAFNHISVTVTPLYTESSPYDIPTTGLVGWWRFDEGAGTLVSDFSGNENDGTVKGGMLWVPGKYNTAGQFDGIDASVIIGDVLDVGTGSMTVVCEFNTTSYTYDSVHGGALVNKKMTNTPLDVGYYIHYNQGGIKVRLSDGVGSLDMESLRRNLGDGKNHQVCVIFDRSSGYASIYIDGILDSQTSIETITGDVDSGTTLSIGSMGTFSRRFNGIIDNVIMYNRTLSDTEIKQLYYDSLRNVQFKTDNSAEYSDAIDSGTVEVPFTKNKSTITSLIAYVPDSVEIGGVTVNDYTSSVTPFSIEAKVYYVDNTNPIWATALGMIFASLIIALASLALGAVREKVTSDMIVGAASSLIILLIVLIIGAIILNAF